MMATLTNMGADELIKLVAVGGGMALGALWIVFASIKGIARSRAQEESRRELAAYVAEGSMTPEDAERLLKAGRANWERGCC